MTLHVPCTYVCFALSISVVIALGGCESGDPYPDSDDDQADESTDDDDGTGDEGGDGPIVIDGYPQLEARCSFPVAEPSRFGVSATDGNTGSVGLVDVGSREVRADLALAQTDIGLAVHGDHLFVINRFGFDYVDVLDLNDDLALLAEFSVAIEDDRSSNPHSLIVDGENQVYVSLYGADEIQVFDLSDLESVEMSHAVDLSKFSDADGLPELGAMVQCGEIVFVAIERLDQNMAWTPTDHSYLVPVDTQVDAVFEFDGDHDGPDGVRLLGSGPKNFRADPADSSGRTILLLTSGLERIDLTTGTAAWVIPDATFVSAGFHPYQLRDFDVGADGMLYFSLANADFSEHMIYRATMDGAGEDLELLVGGLQTVTADLEVVGAEAWFADTTLGRSGLRVFDLFVDPVRESEGSPFATGLPPYGLLPLE